MSLPFRSDMSALKVGESLQLQREDYKGQISRACYNVGLTERKIFSTRKFDEFIFIIRLF